MKAQIVHMFILTFVCSSGSEGSRGTSTESSRTSRLLPCPTHYIHHIYFLVLAFFWCPIFLHLLLISSHLAPSCCLGPASHEYRGRSLCPSASKTNFLSGLRPKEHPRQAGAQVPDSTLLYNIYLLSGWGFYLVVQLTKVPAYLTNTAYLGFLLCCISDATKTTIKPSLRPLKSPIKPTIPPRPKSR